MATRALPLEVARPEWVWQTIRFFGVVTVLVLIALLLIAPDPTLGWTWNLVVPLLPATFLISPAIWRNVCPLATLNELPDRWGIGQRLPGGPVASGAIAIGLLAFLIPARRLILNTNGEVFAGALVVIALLAVGLGMVFAARSGFCNGVCPVLPVERLYGQHPLIEVRGSRCASCTFCTPRGCIDLVRGKASVQMLGQTRHTWRWLFTPTGMFAAAFPGLVLGYFTTVDVSGGMSFAPFGTAALYALVSFVAVAAIVFATRLDAALALTLLGAIAFGIYYWFASPTIADQIGLGAAASWSIRIVTGALLVAWLVKARPVRSVPAAAA